MSNLLLTPSNPFVISDIVFMCKSVTGFFEIYISISLLNLKKKKERKKGSSPAGVAQMIEHRPMYWKLLPWYPLRAQAQVSSLIPRLGCAVGSQWISLSHWCFSSPFLAAQWPWIMRCPAWLLRAGTVPALGELRLVPSPPSEGFSSSLGFPHMLPWWARSQALEEAPRQLSPRQRAALWSPPPCLPCTYSSVSSTQGVHWLHRWPRCGDCLQAGELGHSWAPLCFLLSESSRCCLMPSSLRTVALLLFRFYGFCAWVCVCVLLFFGRKVNVVPFTPSRLKAGFFSTLMW